MKKEMKKGPKPINKKVLMGRKISTVLGKQVQFKSVTTGRMKKGVIAMVGDNSLAVTDRRGIRCYADWEEVFEV